MFSFFKVWSSAALIPNLPSPHLDRLIQSKSQPAPSPASNLLQFTLDRSWVDSPFSRRVFALTSFAMQYAVCRWTPRCCSRMQHAARTMRWHFVQRLAVMLALGNGWNLARWRAFFFIFFFLSLSLRGLTNNRSSKKKIHKVMLVTDSDCSTVPASVRVVNRIFNAACIDWSLAPLLLSLPCPPDKFTSVNRYGAMKLSLVRLLCLEKEIIVKCCFAESFLFRCCCFLFDQF